jgi:hypothetical protein
MGTQDRDSSLVLGIIYENQRYPVTIQSWRHVGAGHDMAVRFRVEKKRVDILKLN